MGPTFAFLKRKLVSFVKVRGVSSEALSMNQDTVGILRLRFATPFGLSSSQGEEWSA